MINLKKFCSKYDTRNINEPYSQGEWTYATDGCIIVRVPKLLHILEKKEVPDAERIFNEADECGPYKWVPVPKVEVPTAHCDDCNGIGKIEGDTCEECEGSGKLQEIKPVKFPMGTVIISLANIYLDLIRKELPSPQIGLTKEAAIAKPVKIKFNGGSGLLMPIRF